MAEQRHESSSKSLLEVSSSHEKLDCDMNKNTLYNSTSNSRSSKRISVEQVSIEVNKETMPDSKLLSSNEISQPFNAPVQGLVPESPPTHLQTNWTTSIMTAQSNSGVSMKK